jgi:hypothetical protein
MQGPLDAFLVFEFLRAAGEAGYSQQRRTSFIIDLIAHEGIGGAFHAAYSSTFNYCIL